MAKEKFETVRRLHDRVATLKKSREWRSRYMRFKELLTKADRLAEPANAAFLNEMYRKYSV